MSASSINPFTEYSSRNSNSTRAVPLKTIIQKVKEDPFIPTFETAKAGMSGSSMNQQSLEYEQAIDLWERDLKHAIESVEEYDRLGIHKAKPSKLLTPYLRIQILVTATNWGNFFKLRVNPSADVDFQEQGRSALSLYEQHQPTLLNPGEWHIPYDESQQERQQLSIKSLRERLLYSVANNARLSYLSFDNSKSLEDNLRLATDLINCEHWSPAEHPAMAMKDNSQIRNLTGFMQLRYFLENNIPF